MDGRNARRKEHNHRNVIARSATTKQSQSRDGRLLRCARHDRPQASSLPGVLLLALCLGILALRVTYTEAPTAQTILMASSLTDTIYSLTLSGLLIFTFVGWLLWRFVSGQWTYRITGMEIGLALFLMAAILSSFGASDKRAAINHTTILLGPAVAALLLSQILDGPGRIRLVLMVLVALGIVSAYQCAEQFLVSNAITIEQYEKDPHMLLDPLGIEAGTFQHFLFEHRLYSRGIRGFFTTSNSAAAYAVCALFAAIALLAGKLRQIKNHREELRYGAFTLLATLLVGAGLFLTQSKGGILAFVAGLGVFALLMLIGRRFGAPRRRMVVALFSSLLLLVVAIGGVAVVYGLRHARLPGGNSMLVRWQYWAATARMYADHALTGVGPGNFSDYYPHYKPDPALESVADPHSWPLSVLAQYGPLGLLGFLAMIFLPLWRWMSPPIPAAPTDHGSLRPPSRALALGLLASVCLVLLVVRPLLMPTSGTDDPDVRLYEIITLFITPVAAFLIGFLLVASPFRQDAPSPSDLPHWVSSAAIISALLAVLLHSLIDYAIFEPGVSMAFWILLACFVAVRLHPEQDPSARPRPPGPKLRWLAGGVALALLGSYLHWVWIPVYEMTTSLQKAQQTSAVGRFDEAHRFLEAAMQADPLSPVAASFSGRLYQQRAEQTPQGATSLLEEAAGSFREAIARSPADYKNYEKLAQVYNEGGRYEAAYEWYLKATERYPGRERLWFELGQVAERLGKTSEARDYYARAVRIEDSYREQFHRMYAERKETVSRLGEKEYGLARERIAELSN